MTPGSSDGSWLSTDLGLTQTELFDASPPSQELVELTATRTLLDSLLTDARLYRTTEAYKDLLDFVIRLRNFAPFNAMLLQVQKPGLTYAASAADWWTRFGRKPKEGARPLLILWPFAPVALVYDSVDTAGKPLPQDVASFFASGPIDETKLGTFRRICHKNHIDWIDFDGGDAQAGAIRCVHRPADPRQRSEYRMRVNKNHSPAVRFTTLAHELAHLFLGHLGPDKALSVPSRLGLGLRRIELEAESVAYVVCHRNGVTSRSETYLDNFVNENTTIDDLDIYQVLRAAGQIETLLGLAAKGRFT